MRDALSLLDRALLNQNGKSELDLKEAQKIFGYFDKSFIIKLFSFLLKGDEEEVVKTYRSIYAQGIEPKVFLNDFLEILYYIKNIASIKLDGTNFLLNDENFAEIKSISKKTSPEILLLFWQFTIKTLNELEIVSNQNLSMEMFLIRLLYLKDENIKDNLDNIDLKYSKNENNLYETQKVEVDDNENKIQNKNKTINQIKNFSQEEISKPEKKIEAELTKIKIVNFDELIDLCNKKKELKLKYELETNVSLVSFSDQKIEISFNENLDKNFVKDLSFKLNEWTGQRWIIAFSKEIGKLSKKEKKYISKTKIIENVKKEEIYKKISRCKNCGSLKSNSKGCNSCENNKNKYNKICVVENIADQWSIESSSVYQGYFHILGGTLSTSNSQKKEDLLINSLVDRIQKDKIEEVILATSATVEGQTTAFYIQDTLKNTNVKISKLAQGLPVGGEIENLDDGTLISAFKNRQNFSK